MTLQDFRKVQAAQVQSLQLLLQRQRISQSGYVGFCKSPSLEEAFASFVLSYKAVNPLERQDRMNAIRANITDETSALLCEMMSLFGAQSDSDTVSSTPEESVEGSECGYLSWLQGSEFSDSNNFFMDSCTSSGTNPIKVCFCPQEERSLALCDLLRACTFLFFSLSCRCSNFFVGKPKHWLVKMVLKVSPSSISSL